MVKIGVDASPLRDQMTGVGNYLFYLLQELIQQRPEDTFYLYAIRNSHALQKLRPFSNVVIKITPFLGFSEALWSQTTLSFVTFFDHLDIFWGGAQTLPLLTRKHQRNFITIYDFTYLLYPKTTTLVRGSLLRWFGQTFYEKADVRMAISQGTANRLNRLYALHSHLVLPPPLKDFSLKENLKILDRYDLKPKDYFLLIGTREPRKNLLSTLCVYCHLLESKSLSPLVLVGKKGWKDRHIRREIDRFMHNYPSHIRWIDYLPDEELNTVLSQAKAYIMPSLYEGYGMPIAEARILGTPVICSAIPEMIEAAEGDGFFIHLENFHEELKKAFLTPPTGLQRPCTYFTQKELATTLSETISAVLHRLHSNCD